jgi:hypothetical protein
LGRNVPDVGPLVNPSSENLFLKVYRARTVLCSRQEVLAASGIEGE